ncbi:MAG: hypothetical protein LBG90_08095 [Spirochaetaceae bacterium]|jgi:hypothetical protein|nr:hypothetical protein [Spirochaetaceae bacterium]
MNVNFDTFEKLKNLYNDLIAEGCNQFYIYGIKNIHPADDVNCLNNDGQKWEIYYTERGHKTKSFYSTYDLEDAVNYYKNFIINEIEHWHLICFTRSNELMNTYKRILEEAQIEIIENNIPHYKYYGDVVFRVFVKGKGIFKAKELFDNIPYFDADLARYRAGFSGLD